MHIPSIFLGLTAVLLMLHAAHASSLPFLCATCTVVPPKGGRLVEYDLYIDESTFSPAGKMVRALTINGGIPGPTLHFREGDTARIRVHNRLKNEETSTHWHGLLLPNEQDGVPHVTTPPIPPGGTHTFQFSLRHSGTYWYHSHTHFQEQSGIYGSIVVQPRGGEPIETQRDHVVVLSDWTNEDPHEVQRMLMRGSDYFGIKRRNAQSLVGAMRRGALKDYVGREWSRMNPMDISDVGYDAFLINGKRQTTLEGKPGEKIRLRLINASGSTYFYVRFSGGPMTLVAADGPPVQPVEVDRLFIAIAETYDVLVTLPSSGRWELRATAQDGSGHASAFLGEGSLHPADDPPRPNLYAMDEMLNLALEEQSDDPRASLNLPRPGSPYRLLRATHDTNPPTNAPIRTLRMRLTGDMNRYVWSFDGKTMAQDPYVSLRHGEVVRLELVNDTMMHHPIHLHGHFFRVLNGQGNRSPLKHTVDVPPMSRRVLEFEANEHKDWMFHCHILYHMMSGMARVFRYDEPSPSAHQGDHLPASGHGLGHAANLGEHAHDPWYFWGAASLQSHMSEGQLTLMNARNDFLLNWEIGWEGVRKAEYEVEALYQRYFNANFQAFTGARFSHDPDVENRAVLGFNYRLPLLFWATASVDHEGDARLALSKRFQITSRLGVFSRAEYDTRTEWEWSVGSDFTIHKNLSLVTQYHSEYGLGAGVLIRF
jgi:FtsP/CotA-like multicopper oxidase with cupredoxin domain